MKKCTYLEKSLVQKFENLKYQLGTIVNNIPEIKI